MMQIKHKVTKKLLLQVESDTLQGAKLRGARLRHANLRRQNLTRADLSGANLYGASFRHSDLAGADLQRADLRNANLTGARLERANLTGAVYNDKTEWPDGFDPAAWGALLDLRSEEGDPDIREDGDTDAHDKPWWQFWK